MNDQEMNYGGIFGITSEDFKQEEQTTLVSNSHYRIDINGQNVKNKTYTSRVRLVPNVHSGTERKDRIRKYSYYLNDPDNPSRKIYIDAMCNDPSKKDIVTTAYMMCVFKDSKIYDHDCPVNIAMAVKENCRRSQYWYSLVQIIKDEQQPELEGKIRILRFGKGINDKLNAVMTGDPKMGINPVIPFDPFNGKDLLIKVVPGADSGLADYGHSMFTDGTKPMEINGKPMANTPEDRKQIFEYLQSESPNMVELEEFKYTPEVEDLHIRAVRAIVGDDRYFNKIYRATYGKDYDFPVETTTVTNRAVDVVETVVPERSAEVANPINNSPIPPTPESKFKSLKDNAQATMATETMANPTTVASTADIDDIMSGIDSDVMDIN